MKNINIIHLQTVYCSAQQQRSDDDYDDGSDVSREIKNINIIHLHAVFCSAVMM